jgi:RNA methyltransferase, TrmH family
MLIEKISSRQNPLVKRFRRVRTGSEYHFLFIEGIRLIEEAVRAGAHFESVAFTGEVEDGDRGQALLDSFDHVQCRGAFVSSQVMEAISGTESPQGIAAIVTRPVFGVDDVFAARPELVVVVDQLQDPGNIGSIIRTAEAAGAGGVIATRETVDPYNLKALRASMGSAFRLPVVTGVRASELAEACRTRNVKLVTSNPERPTMRPLEEAAAARQVAKYTDVDLTGGLAVAFGSEPNGVSEEISSIAQTSVWIPMLPGVESLNVAAAAAIVLYEAARQRQFPFQQPQGTKSAAHSAGGKAGRRGKRPRR